MPCLQLWNLILLGFEYLTFFCPALQMLLFQVPFGVCVYGREGHVISILVPSKGHKGCMHSTVTVRWGYFGI